MIEAKTQVIDTASPFLKRVAGQIPGMTGRALKSVGWWLREETKKGIVAGAPGGQTYAPYSDITAERMLDAMRGRGKIKSGKRYRAPRRGLAEHRPMGKLYQATRYIYRSGDMTTIIGWLSKSAEKLGSIQEIGGRTGITQKMRRFFWAAGLPLSAAKSELTIKKRETIGPIHRRFGPRVPDYMSSKIFSYISKEEAK